MNIKFEITKELIGKFHSILQSQLGRNIKGANIEDLGTQYSFKFIDVKDNGSWHVELDKLPVGNGLFRLHCSKMILDIDLDSIKNLNRFCEQMDKVMDMQIEYVNNG